MNDKLKDKCGVFGIWGIENASEYVYFGLHNLQHRGQESCGIVSTSTRKTYSHYGMGIVNDVFNNEILSKLKGKAAIGHCRYSTEGNSDISNAQPILAETKDGAIAVAHNGQIANFKKLRKDLQTRGCIFKGKSDTEIVLHNFSICNENDIVKKVYYSFKNIKPSYSMVLLTKKELIGIRDPFGVRPLVIGKIKNAYVLASETVALDIIGAEFIDNVKPGELIIIDDNGIKRIQLFKTENIQQCVFEYIYFARPDSFLFGNSVTVSEVRKEFGKVLFREHPVEADIVIPVPDSSIDAALGFSYESKIPFDLGLIRSHYIGRTFIEPKQSIRNAKVKKKFNANRSVLENKRIVVVEDSIVRGTTLKAIVGILREFGAKEVHIRVSSPPYKYSCYLGINTADTSNLIASKMNSNETGKFLNADSLGYLSKKGVFENKYLSKDFCTYCFDGNKKIK